MFDLLKKKAMFGFIWNAFDRIFSQLSQLLFNVLLARLLFPEDFGIIGMLSFFIVLSQIFVESGMASGLIQKPGRTEIDFSTVFIFNFFISLIFYLIIFFSAPLLAFFFQREELVCLTRVLGLSIVINSLAIVQRSILTINLDFKALARINLISIIISGVFAVTLAFLGYGIWSLVLQNISMSLVAVFLFWSNSQWKFSLKFSIDSFRQLFSYGSNLLIAGIYSTSLNEIYNLVIGKVYNVKVLGYYTNAKKLSDVSSETVSSIIQQVTFPILASLQDEKEMLIEVFKKIIRITAFFIIPLMTLFALLSSPIINLLFTKKWESTIPLLQLLCFARMVTPISVVNLNILKAVGRSDLFLKVDLIKFPIIVLALIITIPLGVKAMVIGTVFTSVLSFFINSYMPGKLFGYGAFQQLKDIFPVLMASFFMSLTVFGINYFLSSLFLKLLVGLGSGLLSYLFYCLLFKVDEMKYLIVELKRYFNL